MKCRALFRDQRRLCVIRHSQPTNHGAVNDGKYQGEENPISLRIDAGGVCSSTRGDVEYRESMGERPNDSESIGQETDRDAHGEGIGWDSEPQVPPSIDISSRMHAV